MDKKYDYKVIVALSSQELQKRINKYLNKGYSLQGGICLYYHNELKEHLQLQAIVKLS